MATKKKNEDRSGNWNGANDRNRGVTQVGWGGGHTSKLKGGGGGGGLDKNIKCLVFGALCPQTRQAIALSREGETTPKPN